MRFLFHFVLFCLILAVLIDGRLITDLPCTAATENSKCFRLPVNSIGSLHFL